MGIRVALTHVTRYTYDRPVTFGPHVVRLRPAPHARTNILSYSLKIEPAEHFLNWQLDPYSNHLARLVFPKPARQLAVTVDVVADLNPINPFDFFLEESAREYPFRYDDALARELAPYLERNEPGPLLQGLVTQCWARNQQAVDYLVDLNRAVHERVNYIVRLEPGVQTPEETLDCGRGSCRDSAWLLVQLCRNLGLAARFTSGYLIQLVADEAPLEGPAGPTADFTDLHAWAEVYLPGAGWVGLDPTSGLLAAEGHIPLASTAEPQTAAPISGSYSWTKQSDSDDDQVEEKFHFEMAVRRIVESPRVTLPYTEDAWQAVDRLGERIDADLHESDVRLTMGGEPTFVGIDDRDAPEWNTAALGPQKRLRAAELLHRMRRRLAPGGLLHFGQGKWYPGESLPRWAFTCYWRRDNEPVWRDAALVADEERPRGHTAADAGRFTRALAEQLRLNPRFAAPAYEDAWYYLWRERRLPVNVDPLVSRLDDPEERARLARIFETGLGSVVGYILPLRRDGNGGWESGPWRMRKEHIFLIPGDSPMGFRLPLDSLPWEATHARQFMEPRDPFAPRAPLSPWAELRPQYSHLPEQNRSGPPADFGAGVRGSAHGPANGRPTHSLSSAPPSPLVRTALCVEPRDGMLHVFMPPVYELPAFLELVAAIEATAAQLDMPVRIEGYRPPSDERLLHFSVTPDPGVIEVNVPPVQTWSDLVEHTTALYEDAKQSRLSTEKFMLDGRHSGTGGGNHVVLGGPTAADSPLLRRPDLLRSLTSFWNNHPSLSFLFSGLFVGPTSQAPRVDEARHDSLYELDLAYEQIARAGGAVPPWFVDRTFRNLLIDVSGNTHRTEFCIDKLFSPDSSAGRNGLVELRGFEMPPHARMSCVQQLLIRALVASFWRTPYDRRLVRWGTELHDRFMLPHFVQQDLLDVLEELRRGGYDFDPAWFAPHLEFRFPQLGLVTPAGVWLEVRQAIEPWHVLGEQPGEGGAARYVDSSLERVQVKVRGIVPTRHVIACNGRRVPLAPTGTNGEYVAGVRYRAWQPPNCLHPNIGVHTPLVFDVLDTWNDRSLGGCTYHVSHPGGLSYERFPVNAREAESRRVNRFFSHGHTPGPLKIPAAEPQPEFPLTLDLRQAAAAEYSRPTRPSDPAMAPRSETLASEVGDPR